jgi:hypothetical protein
MYNKKKMILITGMLFGVLLMVPLTYISAADDVWEDDFDDGDLDGWDLTTYYSTDFVNDLYVKGAGTIVNENKRMALSAIYNGTHGIYDQADRNSTQVYGHWSFDVDTTSGCHSFFLFVYRDLTPETDLEEEGFNLQKPNGFEGYGLGISTIVAERQLILLRMDANYTNAGPNATSIDDLLFDSTKFADISLSRYDVFHIDITRTPDGNMTVYLDSTPILSLIDNTYTISDAVAVANSDYIVYYDNISVDDNYSWPELGSTTTTTTTTTTTQATPSWPPLVVFMSITALLVFRKRIKGR